MPTNLILKYNFIDINDFGVIFWLKLTNLNDVIYAINLFSVKIDKKKLQSGTNPLPTYHWSPKIVVVKEEEIRKIEFECKGIVVMQQG